MKKVVLFILSLSIICFWGCEDQGLEVQDELNKGPSNLDETVEGKFKKDIEVTDETGENTIFLSIYSNELNLLNKYIENHNFTLMTSSEELSYVEFETPSSGNLKAYTKESNNFSIDEEPKIIVELVTENLKPDIKSFYLNVQTKNNLKSDFIWGTPVAFTTENDFIGVVHKGWGYEFVIRFAYKQYWYSVIWQEVYDQYGANAWFIYPTSLYYGCMNEGWDVHKRRLTLYPHYYQSGINYNIAYSRSNYRGRNCTIGGFDGLNCYVGTPPTGTTAFVYPNPSGAFYYTPLPGNQCPYPGSYFDSMNCYAMDVPSSCEGFIWDNNWYVKPDIITNP